MRVPAALVLFLALAGCDKVLPPAKWEESLARATVEWNKAEYGKAAELCARAVEQAVAARDGAKVLQALECHIEGTWLEGKPQKSFAAYTQVLADFPNDFRSWSGRHRLRNNYAMALLGAERRAEAIAAFETALDADADTPFSSSHDYRARMIILTNLGRLATEAEGPLGLRLSTEFLDELKIRMKRYEREPPMMLGVGDALVPIAQIVRQRGDPAEASELLAIAKERREEDAEALAATPRVCHKFTIRLLAFESCMREVTP